MSNLKSKILAIVLLFLVIAVNFYLYRNEFKVLSDPNDNIFQYALVDEAKNIWLNIFHAKLSPFQLFDSWNERWAEGFPLPQYYSHIPEAAISLAGLISGVSTYKLFVVIRTLAAVLIPLSFFFAALILDLPWLFGVILAFFSQVIFTNGLYGIDISSFLWRGWGLSAELFAIFLLPIAFAYGIDYLASKKNLGKALIFNFLVAAGHFGMFYLLAFIFPLFIVFNFKKIKETVVRFIVFTALLGVSLSYFLIPFLLTQNYRNFSYWDSLWKFNSWGVKQSIIFLFNGDLFDYNRLPILTLLIVFGVFYGFLQKNKLFKFLSWSFIFYFVFFWGRTTFGHIIDFFPGISEFHLHRIVVMVQFVGLWVGAWLVYNLVTSANKFLSRVELAFKLAIKPFASRSSSESEGSLRRWLAQTTDSRKNLLALIIISLSSLFFIFKLEQPVFKYAQENNDMIIRANREYQVDYPDYYKIVQTLRKLPKARVYAGKPGNWGKNFTVGETQVYMALSRDGFAVSGFLPESWSPNSDQEQFFDESNPAFYKLYNIAYVVAPTNYKVLAQASLIDKAGKYALYKVTTDGWFGLGRSNIVVSGKKTDFLNVTRFWFGSELFNLDYPQISFQTASLDSGKSSISLEDLNHYTDSQGLEDIWVKPPFNQLYQNEPTGFQKVTERTLVNGYSAEVKLNSSCSDCVVVLRESFHPNWVVRLNGKKVKTIPVFPFFIGIPVQGAGVYQISATYEPGLLKNLLLILEVLFLGSIAFVGIVIRKR